MLTVLVVGQNRCGREALARVLAEKVGCCVLAVQASPERVHAELRTTSPDVILLDVPLNAAAQLLDAVSSILGGRATTIALGVPETGHDIALWAATGTTGCVTRETPLDELISLVSGLAVGGPVGSARVAEVLFGHVKSMYASRSNSMVRAHLSAREAEILRLVSQGLSNKEIARNLSIQLSTVKNHLHRIFGKLGVRGRAAAAAWLEDSGLLADGD